MLMIRVLGWAVVEGAISACLVPAACATSEKIVYSFKGGSDGATPKAGLISASGKFYGTTEDGGSFGLGTLFMVGPQGAEKVLHSFGSGTDGATPKASLTSVGSKFYGTTYVGGTNGAGTVFESGPGGTVKILYSFSGGFTDAAGPEASLTGVGKTLYGTSAYGGSAGLGTVFSITLSGKEKVLHSFGIGLDGVYPIAGLTLVGGEFYGTTSEGGTGVLGGGPGQGTVFKISHSGSESVIYSFTGGTAYAAPNTNLIFSGGKLYGTTVNGGPDQDGTVFSVTPKGAAGVVYTFGGGSSIYGYNPAGNMIEVDGALYGTTLLGGAYSGGTLFKLSTDGTETVVYSFGNGSDGLYPRAGLIYVGGKFWGTTEAGGAFGLGTVFVVTP